MLELARTDGAVQIAPEQQVLARMEAALGRWRARTA